MLNRHRVLLELLHGSGGTLGRTAFVKLCFLLGRETDLRARVPFYDFLPYKRGPFSFTLYHDVEALSGHGLLVEAETTFGLNPKAAAMARDERARLAPSAASAVAEIQRRYGRMSEVDLVRSVYSRYPAYAAASEIYEEITGAPAARGGATAPVAVYTTGYRGESIDCFLHRLLEAGLKAILDVRNNPVSRKFGFAGSRLADIAPRVGIRYDHIPTLGIPSAARKSLGTSASYERLFEAYEVGLRDRRAEIESAAALVRARPTVLLCAEEDPAECHRSRLATWIRKRTKLPIVHLRGVVHGESACPDHGQDVSDPVEVT